MKYILKKGIVFVLMVALVLSLAPTAFAAESTPVTSFGLIAWQNTNAAQNPYTPSSMSFDDIYNQFLSTNDAAGIPTADMPFVFGIDANQVLQLELRQQSGELGLTDGNDATIKRNTRLILGGLPLQYPTSYTLTSPLTLEADMMIRSADNNGGYATLTFAAPITVANGSTLLIDGSDNSGSYTQPTFNPDIYVNAVESGSAIKVEDGGTLRIGAVSVQSQDGNNNPFVESDGGTVIVQEAATLSLATSEYENGLPTLDSTNNICDESANISVTVPLIKAGGDSTVRIMGGNLSSTGEEPIVVFEEESTGTLLLEGGSIENNAPLVIPEGVTLEIPVDSTATVKNIAEGATAAISLAPGAKVKMGDTSITVGNESSNSYVDNNGIARLAPGATLGDESTPMNAAVLLSDGTLIQGSEDSEPSVEIGEDGAVTITVPNGGSVTTNDGTTEIYENGGTVNQDEHGTTTPQETVVPVENVSLNRDSITLYCDSTPNTATLIANVVPENANDKSITWTTSDPSVVTVENGKVTALKPGTATITASVGGKTDTCEVVVSFAPVIPDSNPINIADTANGSVDTNLSNASRGSVITITATPDAGYVVGSVIVTGPDGRVDVERVNATTYTFVMPNGEVDIDVTFVSESAAFTDVNIGDWFYDYVQYVVANGLMEGVSDTEFAPNATMSRAMVWTILARIDGETVTGVNWVDTARAWAMANGVSDGTDANGDVTREQLATMLWRYAGEPASEYSLAAFTDASSVSEYAATAMAWAVENGIITGMTDTTIAPQGTATRAQCAAMLMRYVENV